MKRYLYPITTRFTKEEATAIRRASKKAGVPVSEFIRKSVMLQFFTFTKVREDK